MEVKVDRRQSVSVLYFVTFLSTPVNPGYFIRSISLSAPFNASGVYSNGAIENSFIKTGYVAIHRHLKSN